MKFLMITGVISAAILSGCGSFKEESEISYEDIKPYTYSEIMKNLPEEKSNISDDSIFLRETFSNNDYSKEFLTTMLDSLGKDKGFFYQVICHKEHVNKKTCISSKIKVPENNFNNKDDNKVLHQTILSRIEIFKSGNRYVVNNKDKFNAVYFEKINNIPDSNFILPVSVTQETSLNINIKSLNKIHHKTLNEHYSIISVLR